LEDVHDTAHGVPAGMFVHCGIPIPQA